MKEKRSLCVVLLSAVLLICGCSQQEKQDKNSGWQLSDNDMKNLNGSGNSNQVVEEEGPQYQQPTMDVLKGKLQKFPAKYPIQRYPNAQVAMVDVRPNRPPGYVNMVMLKTDDNIPAVGNFYNEKLASQEWTKVSEYHNEIYDSTTWQKGDLQCEVRVAQDFSNPSGKRLIQLLYGLKARRRFKTAPANEVINPAPASPG